MKGLTLTQPWAQLVAIGAKQFETRGWRTSYRGPLAIQAAKGFPEGAQMMCLDEPFYSAIEDAGGWLPIPGAGNNSELKLPRGVIIAVVDLVECISTNVNHSGLWPVGTQELAFGDFSPGRWAWRLENVRKLAEPIPVRGFQFLWEVSPDVVAAIQQQLGQPV